MKRLPLYLLIVGLTFQSPMVEAKSSFWENLSIVGLFLDIFSSKPKQEQKVVNVPVAQPTRTIAGLNTPAPSENMHQPSYPSVANDIIPIMPFENPDPNLVSAINPIKKPQQGYLSYPVTDGSRKSVQLNSSYGPRDLNASCVPNMSGKITCGSHWGIDLSMPLNTIIAAQGYGRITYIEPACKQSGAWWAAKKAEVRAKNPKAAVADVNPALGCHMGVFYPEVRVFNIYGHLNQAMLAKGVLVKPGQTLALSGDTGRSTGPHLHLTTCRIERGTEADFLKHTAIMTCRSFGNTIDPLETLDPDDPYTKQGLRKQTAVLQYGACMEDLQRKGQSINRCKDAKFASQYASVAKGFTYIDAKNKRQINFTAVVVPQKKVVPTLNVDTKRNPY